MVDAQSIAEFAVFTIGSVITRIKIKAIAFLITQKVSVFIKVGVDIIKTVVVLVGSVPVESSIQTDAEIVSLVIKLLGIVRSEVTEARL